MLFLQEKLQQVPWAKLEHAYGSAQDTPTWLLALLSDQAEQRGEALYELWASICHQGSVYEASCAAVPFLIEILAEVPEQRKPAILSLLEGLAHVNWYANKNQRFLGVKRSLHSTHSEYQWQSWGEFLTTGNVYHDPHWMQQAHRLVGEGISSYLALLQSSDQDVVKAALDLLAGFQEQNALLIPVIAPMAFKETETSVQIAALHCLGALLEQSSPYWENYQRLAQTPDALPEVVFAVAYTLAWHHPSGVSPAIVERLLAAVLPSQPCDKLRDVCKVFSHLGVPYGFQGLIAALHDGAKYWHILDTIRVVEVLLDVAFFGGWVQYRYWQCRTGNPIGTRKMSSNEDDNEKACFKWDYSWSYRAGSTRVAIESFGYDKQETQRLQDLFAQEGPHALSDTQRQAIETLLQCEPLWQIEHNLLAIYGLPTAKHELEAFLAGE